MNKKTIFAILVIIASVVIVRSFFVPWANVKASVTKIAGSITETAKPLEKSAIGGKVVKGLERATDAIGSFGDVSIKTTVTGYSIPAMVNQKTSKVALSLAQILFKSTEGLDKKSYLVYLLPILGILCALLAAIGMKIKWPVFAMLVISGFISIGGLYNLMTANLSNLYVQISIERGLWHTMYAYLVIFLIGIAWAVTDMLGKNAEKQK